jgi:hypothetical protein
LAVAEQTFGSASDILNFHGLDELVAHVEKFAAARPLSPLAGRGLG